MRLHMSTQTRQELVSIARSRYQSATWTEKRQILNEVVANTGYDRKYAIRLSSSSTSNSPANAAIAEPVIIDPSNTNLGGSNDGRRPRVRSKQYDEPVRVALIAVWKTANCICSKRLVPFLPELVTTTERFGHLSLSAEVRERLLSISRSTVDRLLLSERQVLGRSISTTRRGRLLKHQIPVRAFADWNDVQPGFMEADLVAHCGDRADGAFLNTLVLTDIATGWTECLALQRRSEADVTAALREGQRRLPFRLLGLDTDNGSEFINYELLHYCQREGITFTRSRAYRKNDQAHVEEKNGSIVRRLVGYDRYEGVAAWQELAALYRVLRLYVNFFQPSLKLISKERHGARVTKRYDRAQTPFQRIAATPSLEPAVTARLHCCYAELDPVALLQEMERLQDRLWLHAWKQPEAGQRHMTQHDHRFTAPNKLEPAVAPTLTQQPQHLATFAPALVAAPANVGTDTRPLAGPLRHEASELMTTPGTEASCHLAMTTPSEPDSAAIASPSGDPKSPRMYRRSKKERVPHTWRTREDPFAEVWKQITLQLQIDPGQTAKSLLEQLHEQYPGQFTDGQIRTLQRRVKQWRQNHLYSDAATWDAFYANLIQEEVERSDVLSNGAAATAATSEGTPETWDSSMTLDISGPAATSGTNLVDATNSH